jgi:uncharacterized membrane protein (UPF0127 family)
MNNRFLAPLLAALVCYGCSKVAPPPSAAAGYPGLPTSAQPKLSTIKIWLGKEELVTEMALTPEQQACGMMFRTNMADNEAMIFPLPFTTRAAFWMMNCPHALSAAYIDTGGTIQEIHEFQPFNTNAVLSTGENIRFVLEASPSWYERHNINTGAVVRTERGSLMETFFHR